MLSKHMIEKKNTASSRRARLMGGASAALIANLLPVAAQASMPAAGARVTVAADGHSDMQGHTVVGSSAPQTNAAAIRAAVEGASAGIQRSGTSSGNSDSVSTNIISAKAVANSFSNGDDTILSSIGTASDNGVALSGVSINSGTVTSDVTESSTSVSLTDATSGRIINNGNTISASTMLNSGTSTIGGSVPVGYQPSFGDRGVTAGSTFDSESESLVDARGSVAVSTVQQSLNSGASAASVTDSRSTLRLNSMGNSTYAGAAALDTNNITADFAGNKAGNSISLASDASGFAGSASLANVQQFDGTNLDEIEGPGLSSAAVRNSSIYADLDNSFDEEEGAASTTLTGSLSVTGNKIGSTAYGNQVVAPASDTRAFGNQIKLADGQSFTSNDVTDEESFLGGAGAAAMTDPQSRALGFASADLAIANSQSLTHVESGRGVTALTDNSYIWADVQAVKNGSAAVADNAISAAATGNVASSGIVNGTNAAIFAGSAAIANAQANRGVAVSAIADDAEVGLWSYDYSNSEVSGTLNSQLSVTNNSLTSSAYANDAAQVVSLTATTLGNANTPGKAGLFAMDEAMASGVTAIVNKQTNESAPTSAFTDGEVTLDVESRSGTSNSALSLAANHIEAVTIGSTASNSLTLASTSMQGGSAIASTQSNVNSPVVARTYADNEGEVENDLLDGSTLSVTNNLARAIGYGNSATNAISATTGNLTIEQADVGQLGLATGAIAAANSQFSASSVAADLQAYAGAYVDGDLDGSKLVNSDNTFVSAAYGNHAANTASLSLDSLTIDPLPVVQEGLTSGHMASLGSLVSLQSASDTISASNRYSDVYSYIDDDVRAGSIDSSNNLMQSLASANRVDSNSLTISGTNLTDADNYRAGLQLVDDDGRTASQVYNAQRSSANVLAQTLAMDNGGGYAGVTIEVDDDIEGSSVTALANRQIANATANTASNALSLTATTVKTTSGLQNVQQSAGAITAQLGELGAAASPGTADQPFSYTVTISEPSANCIGAGSGTCTVTGGTARIGTVSLSTAQISALVNEGWSLADGVLTRNAVYLGTMPFAAYGALQETGQISSSLIPGTPPQPGYTNSSGVSLETYGDIVNSVLKVADNVGAASATGNSASNVLKVSATTLSADGSNGFGYAGDDADNQRVSEGEGVAGVRADHGVINSQSIVGPVSATSYGAYAIRSYGDEEEGLLHATDSTLDVSRNEQSATAFGNTATTSLTAAAGTTDGTFSAGLLSTQTSGGNVSALSNLQAFAPVVSSGSTVTLNDNSNTATAVANDAKNTVAASATNFASDGYGYASADGAEGNVALRNEQSTSGAPVTAAATTTIANQEGSLSVMGGQVIFDGVRSGTVAMNGNSTLAQAAANQATNSVALNAGVGQGGTSALSSKQSNASAVTSNAASTIGFELAANGQSEFGALNATGLTVTGNSTVANARGNAVVNTATANSNGTTLSGYPAYAGSGYADAANAVLNSQSNNAAINANATSTNVVQALNGAMAGTVANVGGNTTLASAYGNAATNTLTVNQMASGTPSGAVANSQYNSGAVSATVTSVTYTAGVNGATAGSSMGVTANTIGATAVGNNAVSTITSAR